MQDQYTKFTNAISSPKTNATRVAHLIPDHWVAICSIPSNPLTGSGSKLVSTCFVVLCSTLIVNNIRPTEYEPRINDQAEGFKSTLISRVRDYVCEDEANWDGYLLPITYAYNGKFIDWWNCLLSIWRLRELHLYRTPS